jgi:HEAT repeat protein
MAAEPTPPSAEEEEARRLRDLVRDLRSRRPEKRRWSAGELLRKGRKAAAAVPDLVQALRDGDAWVRLDVAKVLKGFAQTAVPLLVEVAVGPEEDEQFREAAVAALGAIGPPSARPATAPLLEACRPEGVLVQAQEVVVHALANFGRDAAAILADYLEDDSLAPLAAAALAKIHHGAGAALEAAAWTWAYRAAKATLVLIVFGAALSLARYLDGRVMPASGGIGLAAAAACGLLALRLGQVSANKEWGGAGTLVWTLVLGVGGIFFGSVVGGLFGAATAPVQQVLQPTARASAPEGR